MRSNQGSLEHFAKIMFVAHQLGGSRSLPGEDVQTLIEARQRFGIRSDAPVCDVECKLPISQSKESESKRTEVERVTEEVVRRVLAELKKNAGRVYL